MFTRSQYLNGEVSHQDYYMQFATEQMQNTVALEIGIERIKQSRDEHLNDIPLHEWDGLGARVISKECKELLKQANDVPSLATMVCIYKAIARSLIKNKTN